MVCFATSEFPRPCSGPLDSPDYFFVTAYMCETDAHCKAPMLERTGLTSNSLHCQSIPLFRGEKSFPISPAFIFPTIRDSALSVAGRRGKALQTRLTCAPFVPPPPLPSCSLGINMALLPRYPQFTRSLADKSLLSLPPPPPFFFFSRCFSSSHRS